MTHATCNNVKRGDLVKLNSGGPAMTINAITSIGVWGTWFTDAGQVQQALFPFACVHLIRND